jgi:hypothetical protein
MISILLVILESRLTDQIYSVDIPATSRPPSLGAGSLLRYSTPPLEPIGHSVNTDGSEGEGALALA